MLWFIGALVVLLLAFVLDLGLLAYAVYALLAVMLVSRWLARRWAEGLAAERSCSRLEANVGDTVSVKVVLRNDGRMTVPWVLIEDVLPPQVLVHEKLFLQVSGTRIQLYRLKAGEQKTLLYHLRCNRRGYYQIGPLVVETGDVFGLHRRYRIMSKPSFLMVYPKVVPMEGYDIASRRPIGEVRMTYRLYEDPTRIAGVREYEAGDPLNRVHWRATARTGKLHSKVYEPSTVAGATILLDFHLGSHEAKDEPFRSELAVTAAASVASMLYEMQQQVGLITNGRDASDRIRQEGWRGDARSRNAARQSAAMLDKSDRLAPLIVETRRGPEQFMHILEALARLELTDGLNLAQLVVETSSRMPRDATVMAIVPRVTTEIAVALGTLQRNGYAVSALLNLWDEYDFAQAAGPLLAEGVEARHLKDEQSIAEICRGYVLQ